MTLSGCLETYHFVMHSGRERAFDQLGQISSPMRQLYYLAGLNVSTPSRAGLDHHYNPEIWADIVKLLNEIEEEYYAQLFQKEEGIDIEEWKKVREVAVPSFLTYFNVGPMNYEEQIINWVKDLFTPFDDFLIENYGSTTGDFISFYKSLDRLAQNNFQAFTMRADLLRPNWEDYTDIKSGMDDSLPDFFKESIPAEYLVRSKFMIDKGMKDRFYASELVSQELTLEKIEKILTILSLKREERDFLYYTETNPGNPLYDFPILSLDKNMYQVFEMKQVIHSINNWLENKVGKNPATSNRYLKAKGNLLEKNIVDLFVKLFGSEATIFKSYYIDGNEQDILIIWQDYAFIIEAKGYNIREPFRNPQKAFKRINDDFQNSIGYGYDQARRVEAKIQHEKTIEIQDSKGNTTHTIDTNSIKESFSIIVTQNSLGLVQNDLSYLLKIDDDDMFPWAVKYDDLEIFILTLLAKKKTPKLFVDFLLFREEIHGKIRTADELEICGGFLTNKLNARKMRHLSNVPSSIDFADVFDDQYNKGLGLRDENNLAEKQSGKYLFW